MELEVPRPEIVDSTKPEVATPPVGDARANVEQPQAERVEVALPSLGEVLTEKQAVEVIEWVGDEVQEPGTETQGSPSYGEAQGSPAFEEQHQYGQQIAVGVPGHEEEAMEEAEAHHYEQQPADENEAKAAASATAETPQAEGQTKTTTTASGRQPHYTPQHQHQHYHHQHHHGVEADIKPLDLTELSEAEKQQALETLQAAFDSSHSLQVTGIDGDITTSDLEPIFAEFGKVNSVVVEPSRRDAAIVRMPYAAAQKAKEHFADQPLKVKDKQLNVVDAIQDCLLFVGNLNDDVEPEQLRSLFQAHGEPERVIVMRSAMTGRRKGYGFVEMRTKAQAAAAKAVLGGSSFHGRSLRIDWCRLSKLAELQSPVLFVDRLPLGHTDTTALKQLFQRYGTIKNVNVPVNPMNQLSRGFAFVTFTSGEDAETARDALHNAEFQGTHVRISYGNPSKSDLASGPVFPRFASAPMSMHGPGPYGRGNYPPPMYPGRGGRGGYYPPMGRAGWGRGFGGFEPSPPGFAGRGFGPGRGGRGGFQPTPGPPYHGYPPQQPSPRHDGFGFRPSHQPGPYMGGGYRRGPGPSAPILPTPSSPVRPTPSMSQTGSAPYSSYRPSGPSYSGWENPTAPAPSPPTKRPNYGYAPQGSYPPAAAPHPPHHQQHQHQQQQQQPSRPSHQPTYTPAPHAQAAYPGTGPQGSSTPYASGTSSGYGSYGAPYGASTAVAPTRPSYSGAGYRSSSSSATPTITASTYNYHSQQTGQKRTHETMQSQSAAYQTQTAQSQQGQAASGSGSGTSGYQSYPPTQAYVAYNAPEPWNPNKRPHY